MKIFALEIDLPNVTPESFKRYAREEPLQAWELRQAGLVRELYFRDDRLKPAASHAILNGSGQGGFLSWL